MEIRQYFAPFLKWWKLILVACLLAAVSSFLFVSRTPPQYQTSSVLVIGQAVYDPNPTGGELGLAQQLSTYYADIAGRDVVRRPTMDALKLTWLPDYTLSALPNSQILEIAVTDTDPVRAQAVANELARQLINQSPSNPNLQEQQRQEFIRGQLALLETQIQDTQDEITTKESALGSLNSARQITQAQAEISGLQQKMSTLQTNYASLLNASSGQGNNSLTLFQAASLPTEPIGPDNAIMVLMSIAVAFLISTGAAYLIEYLDDSLKTGDEVTRQLNLPMLGYIPEIINANGDRTGLMVQDAKSVEAEAFRALLMNLRFLQNRQPFKTLLIASVGETEGKSVISANLALAMARAGINVLLLDADLRRPSLHEYVNLPNEVGLSSIFLSDISIAEAAVTTEQENLAVITTGSRPPNPGELISSPQMDDIIRHLAEQYDMVIIDGPPVLVTDATILSAKVDGVLLVVGAGRTRRGDALIAMKQMEQAGARVIGAVLNRVTGRNRRVFGLYHYDYGMEPKAREPRFSLSRLNLPFLQRRHKAELSPAKVSTEAEHSDPLVDDL